MADDNPPPNSLEAILLDFLEQKRKDEHVSADAFLSAHASTDPRLRDMIRAAQEWTDAEVDAELARLTQRDTTHDTLVADVTARIEHTVPLVEDASVPRETIDNRYRVARVLGEGGFGKVFLVEDSLYAGEKRALKVILPAHSSDAEFEKRFKNEILVLRALSHPGIPQIYNDGKTAKGEFYYTMAFVPGATLSDVLKKSGPLPPQRIVRIVRQLLAVLDYAHEKGVVHRDLKPSNIMLVDAGTEKEQAKILDFGIAKVMRHEGAFEAAETMNTLAGMGTPHYMSPEQIRGQDIDGRSDIYALGIIIYQMCSGLMPFTGKTAMEIATARLEQAPKPLDDKTTPEWLKQLVMKLLERNRDRRPQTKQIFEQFDRLAGGQRDLRRSLQWIAVGVLALALGMGWLLWQFGDHAVVPVQEPLATQATPAVSPADTQTAPKGPEVAKKTLRARTLTTGQDLRTSSITFAGDCDGIARVHVEVRNTDSKELKQTELPVQTGGSFSADLALGAGRWHLEAFDDAERTKALLAADFVIDLERPTLRLEPVKGQKIGTEGSEALVDTDHIAIQGLAQDAPPGTLSRVTIDGNAVKVAPDGSFQSTITFAKAGPRRVTAHAEDKAGNAIDEEIALRYAPDKPKITLMQPANGAFEGRANDTYLIKGRVLNAPCRHLRVDADDITDQALTKEDEFAYSVTIPKGKTAFEFTAEDALGRKSAVAKVTLTSKDKEDEAYVSAPNPKGSSAANDALVPAGCTRIAGVELDTVTRRPKAVMHTLSGVRLVLIPAGHVQRDDGSADVAQALYMGQYEVTNEQWARFAASAGRSAPSGDAQKPVTNVAFDDATAFCKWAGLRLATRSEWIYAACGGKNQDYPWGSTFVMGNCVSRDGDSDGAIAAVGSTPGDKSAFDVYDMAGNVQEWCTDGAGGKAALCGGSFSSSSEACRIGAHISVVTTGGKKSVGFRVVLVP